MTIAEEVGKKIRHLRKQKNLSIQEMSRRINKSVSTVSKYENGIINVDIETLYDIAEVLQTEPTNLLYHTPMQESTINTANLPPFFKDTTRLYMYLYDGRNESVHRAVIDIISQISVNEFRVMLYSGIFDYNDYQNSEITYAGILTHYDALSNIIIHNRDHAKMETSLISIPASYINSPAKWGLTFGISTRPIMPLCAKALFTKKVQDETPEFIERLKFSENDVKKMRINNLLSLV